jgi:acetyl-CoA carboxylase carboxyl transferase subunit alpha
MASTRDAISTFLADFAGRGRLETREHRREKFLAIGTTI